jgi:hypothetical protein
MKNNDHQYHSIAFMFTALKLNICDKATIIRKRQGSYQATKLPLIFCQTLMI